MQALSLPAYAKLNLTLDILRKREDGYHELRMVMQSIALHDDVTLQETKEKGIVCRSNLPYLSSGSSNIAVKAAVCFFAQSGLPQPGLEIVIQKRIPVSAGMAGGSADGAAVLRALRSLYAPQMPWRELERIALLVGSDVPFCLRGGTMLAEGRGEILTELPPLPNCHLLLCKPPFPISTAELFRCTQVKKIRLHPDTGGLIHAIKEGSMEGLYQRMYNVFEDVLPQRYRAVLSIKHRLGELGARAALMTGSGPTVYGVFEEADAARYAYQVLRREYVQTFLTTPVEKIV